jgi:hypothetical protein
MHANWPLRVIAALAIVATGVASVASLLTRTEGSWPPVWTAVVAAYLAVGVLIVERRRGNPVGLILLAMGFLIATYAAADVVIQRPDASASAAYLAWLVSLMDAPLFAMVAYLFLLFPDGHLPSPRWRWVGLAVLVFGSISMIGTAVIPGPFPFYPEFDNPFGIAGTWVTGIMSVFYLLTIACVGAAVLSLIGRWRTGGPVERAQLKWVTTAAVLIAAVMVAYAILFGPRNFNDIADLAVGVALGFFPIAIGIAILRYRLFEIDRLVSRTIGYVVITALLVGAYASVILLLQGPLGAITGGETVSVALSTLVAAALFQPLRRRVQAIVDRRFDRARFDAERTTAAFSERLRGEVDIAALAADLDATVHASLKPRAVGLWIRGVPG